MKITKCIEEMKLKIWLKYLLKFSFKISLKYLFQCFVNKRFGTYPQPRNIDFLITILIEDLKS